MVLQTILLFRVLQQEPISGVSVSGDRKTNEISLHKNNEPDLQTRIYHELVFVLMLYYIVNHINV